MSIRFDGKVAIVTGAGGGIGKQHALELARRGAKVVVNDLGGSVDGSGASNAAEEVVEQIKADGGEAISNGASVTDLDAVKAMVAQMDAEGFGNCTNTGACEVECPKGISLDNIARMNRELMKSKVL